MSVLGYFSVVAGAMRFATFAFSVTGATSLGNNEVEERILFTIDSNLFHLQHVTASHALFPKLRAATAPIGRKSAPAGFIKGFLI